jgi:hypothetical protein
MLYFMDEVNSLLNEQTCLVTKMNTSKNIWKNLARKIYKILILDLETLFCLEYMICIGKVYKLYKDFLWGL